jgi:hypothetical protein
MRCADPQDSMHVKTLDTPFSRQARARSGGVRRARPRRKAWSPAVCRAEAAQGLSPAPRQHCMPHTAWLLAHRCHCARSRPARREAGSGGRTGTPPWPYPRCGGTRRSRLPPRLRPVTPASQPLITSPSPATGRRALREGAGERKRERERGREREREREREGERERERERG